MFEAVNDNYLNVRAVVFCGTVSYNVQGGLNV